MENTDTEIGLPASAHVRAPAAHAVKATKRTKALTRVLYLVTAATIMAGALVAPTASHSAPPARDNDSCAVCDASATIIT